MKPFSPLKPLIAAMFVLAAASASAQVSFTPVADPENLSDTYAAFSQDFTVLEGQWVTAFTFLGTQTLDTSTSLTFFGGSSDPMVSYGGTYTGSGWKFDGFNLGAGDYTAFMLMGLGAAPTATDLINVNFSVAGVNETATGYLTYRGAEEPQFGSFQVTAVPEPESYAMLLAGLGLMGAIARRRSRKV